MPSVVRLHLDHPLAEGQAIPLSQEQAHYLFGVMRLGPGARLRIFNGRDGEWEAEVAEGGKRAGRLVARERTREQAMPPDLWLLFAPIKKARTDFIVEKASEMGCRRILPVQTEFMNSERIKAERLRAHAVEAAEQCGGVFVPEVTELARLGDVLATWDAGRTLWFCDEALAGAPGPVPPHEEGPGAVLIGPEGGFSEAERARLRALPWARPVRLGPRILRADTAAVAALGLWMAAAGDWSRTPER
jgi:16S rRNA (uracil1498-N3)-methyltransferase